MKRLISFLLTVALSMAVAQSREFNALLKAYEKSMNRSAKQWMEKQYARALDSLYRTSDYLAKHMPPPEQRFDWNGCIALKTYTIVFARMVEEDMYRAQNQEKMITLTKTQAMKWADLLEVQSGAWRRVRTQSVHEDSLRGVWINRFHSIIRQARKQ